MLPLKLHVDFSDVVAGLDNLARLPAARIHRELKPLVRADQAEHASKRTGPGGRWAPRALATVEKMRLEHVRRRPLGKLTGGGVSYRSTASAITATSKIPWSGVHQEGGRVGRGAEVPARPFLWISDALLHDSQRLVVDQLAAAFGGR